MSAPQALRDVLARELPGLYAFAFSMCGERGEARRQVGEIVTLAVADGGAITDAPDPSRALLRLAARHFEANFNSKSPHSFDKLDEILRTDITRPIDLTTIGMSDDPKKVHLLCWELKRTCLTAVLSCLPPGVRLSFLLTDMLGLGPDEAAELIGIKPSAYRVRLTRARKRVEDYLAPRCVHVDRANPCTCNGRLMIALDANFVSPPNNEDEIPHTAHDADGPHRDVGNLFRQLPKALLTKGDMETLLGMA
jgi:RNA polymerase sigma-70 factor (ECF subfamily)